MVVVQLRLFADGPAGPLMGLASHAELVSALRGCLDCRLYRAAAGPPELLYVELWEDWASLETHVGTGQFRRLLELMELSTRPPELDFFEMSDRRGLEFVERVRGVRRSDGNSNGFRRARP